RGNAYPTREFLARARQENQIKSCHQRQAEDETFLHIIGYCPMVQDARIKRHNQLWELLADKAKNKELVVFQEPVLKDEQNELYKTDLVFVKGYQAFVVDITVRYESKPTSLAGAVVENVKKYQHLKDQIQELTNVAIIKFTGFPLEAHGKWYQGNYKMLAELGHSSS
ncbi:hypothetical protein N338_04655, partial [Podiceps cristatus]